jgi:hypothetical protein
MIRLVGDAPVVIVEVSVARDCERTRAQAGDLVLSCVTLNAGLNKLSITQLKRIGITRHIVEIVVPSRVLTIWPLKRPVPNSP